MITKFHYICTNHSQLKEKSWSSNLRLTLLIKDNFISNVFSQAQIVVLAAQILWSEDVEAALSSMSNDNGASSEGLGPLDKVLAQVSTTLNVLADSVLQEQPPLRRKKLEHLVRY